MKDEPDIVKELKEAERLGIIRGKEQKQSVCKDLETAKEKTEAKPDEKIDFADDYVEGRCHLIIEATNDLICTTTSKINPVYTYINSSYERILGYTPNDMIGKSIWDFVHPDDKKKMLTFLEKYVGKNTNKFLTGKSGSTVEIFESRVRDKSGNWHHLENTVNIVGNELLFVAKDVTERKQIEENVHKFKAALESATDAIGISTPDGVHYFQNKAFNRMFGDIGSNPPDSVYVDKKVGREVFDTIMNGEEWTGEVEMYGKDKNVLSIHLRAFPVKKEGKVIAIAGIHTDITERKKAEEEIRYLHDYNENILESNPNPIMVIKGNVIEYVNNSFLSTFEKNKTHYISKKLDEVIPSDIIPDFKELLENHNKTKELELKNKNFSVNSFIVKKAEEEEEEEEERIGIVMQDITERKQMEYKIQERLRELTSLYAISRDMQEDFSTDEFCQRTIQHILPAMQFSEIAVPVVEIHGKQYTVKNYSDKLSHNLHADITVDGEKQGRLWVYYTEEKPFLIPEEQNMVNGVAQCISLWLEHKQIENENKKRTEELERFNKFAVGRELKMIELKKEINELCKKYGEKPRYNIQEQRGIIKT